MHCRLKKRYVTVNLPELLPKQLLHELDVGLPVLKVDSSQSSSVIDSVYRADKVGGEVEVVAGKDAETSILRLKGRS